MWTFARTDVLPSWWANVVGRALSTMAAQFQLVKSDDTHVQVPAAADAGAAVVAVGGLWRWNEATLTRAHPGGVAGIYPVFVTARAQQIDAIPVPYTDDTNYSFDLAILAPGATPAIVAGVVDVYRRVGSAVWDGAKITRVDQLVPLATSHGHQHAGGSDPIAPLVTALPAGPSDGQEVHVNVADGVTWRLRYNAGSGSTHKWEYVGGPPLVAEIAASESRAAGAYGNLPTVGPSIVVPFVGDYDVEVAANITVVYGAVGKMSPNMAGIAPVDADAAILNLIGAFGSGSGSSVQARVARRSRHTGVGTGLGVIAQYSSGDAACAYAQRQLSLWPVRLG